MFHPLKNFIFLTIAVSVFVMASPPSTDEFIAELSAAVVKAPPPAPLATNIGTANATHSCHRRLYTQRVVQTDANGRRCWDMVSSWSCQGHCISQQVAAWYFPHKESHHPVCVHMGRFRSVAYLRECDVGVAAKTRRFEYVEAAACKCQVCCLFDVFFAVRTILFGFTLLLLLQILRRHAHRSILAVRHHRADLTTGMSSTCSH